jgi:regulator of cell morphogenesis and NO signaling
MRLLDFGRPEEQGRARRLEGALLDVRRGQAAPTGVIADLIDHLRASVAPAHPRQLKLALRLARRAEARHAGDVDWPGGLIEQLETIAGALRAHRRREDRELFPSAIGGDAPRLRTLIAQMRDEHDAIADHLVRLAVLTRDFTAPEGAGRAWRALCGVLRRLNRELREQMRLESDVLYPWLEDPEVLAGGRPAPALLRTA